MAFSAHDVVPDSPTNNFATLNPLDKLNSPTFSQGNLRYYANGTGVARSTLGFNSGKFYFEICQESSVTPQTPFIYGLSELEWLPSHDSPQQAILVYNNNSDGHSIWSYVNGSVVQNDTGYFTTTSAGDVWQFAYDVDTGKAWVGRNGTWFNSGDPVAGTGYIYQFSGDYTMAPVMNHAGANYTAVLNTGADSSFAGNKTAQGNTDDNGYGDFYYAPPTGYLALCTANLPDPDIDPAKDDVPEDYFKAVTYTGNSSTQPITSVGFQPDLVWIKGRNANYSHMLYDTLRGVNNNLRTDTVGQQSTGSPSEFTSFNSDGFTVVSNGTTQAYVNLSNKTYVAWCWKAGGAPSADGVAMVDGTATTCSAIASAASASITPTRMSVNTKAGFSIIKCTTQASGTATVPHGLSQAPEFFVLKTIGVADQWRVYSKDLGAGYQLYLNLTNAETPTTTQWNNTAPSSNVFSLGTANEGSLDVITYCWHSVAGYSAFGSYSGSYYELPYIYTGFKPAFVMIKCSSSDISGYGSWIIYDNARDTFNSMENVLYANKSAGEGYRGNGTSTFSGLYLDFVSNGFKIRVAAGETNDSSEPTYIYAAFAEQPFKYANAR